MSGAEDDHAPISNDAGARAQSSSTPGEGDHWPVGEHAALGLESLEGWQPPVYRAESTATPAQGTDSLLADAPPAASARHARYRAESTIGSDERVRIYETTKFPWRAICQLAIHTRDDEEYIGTGFFVDARTIVTAGHCVYLPEMGGWADRIVVSPARNGRDRPYSSVVSKRFHSVRGWTEKLAREQDYAVIRLEPEDAMPEVGTLAYAVYDTPTLVSSYFNLAGYPSDKDGGTSLWWSARRSAQVSAKILTYDADTAAGQSGAPVWRLEPSHGQRVVVGVHTNGARTGNSATRITNEVFRNLERWRAKDS